MRYESGDDKVLLQVRPVSVQKGSLDDFEGYKLDATAKQSTPYYVTVDYRSLGGATLKYPYLNVKLEALNEDGDPAQKLIVGSSIGSCKSDQKAALFRKGDSVKECGIFLVPKGQKVTSVMWSGDFENEPITWKVAG